jgi:hypothetical protein
MNKKFLLILAVWLLCGPLAANAELIQSTTGVYLTFRHCVSGETVCDSIGPTEAGSYGGLPGGPTATADHADPTYGEASGSAQLTAGPGAAELSANATSLPIIRNGANSIVMQRYTNASANAELLNIHGTLTYQQTIPVENAGFPSDSPARSGTNAEIVIVSIDADYLEAGTTSEENSALLLEGPDPSIDSEELGVSSASTFSKPNGSGTETFSSTVTVEPGDSIWVWIILQSLVANGAEVSASLTTNVETVKVD